MRTAAVVLALVAMVLGAGVVRAADANATAEAKKRYAQGVRHYDLAEYAAALAEFKEAYRAADDPAFLFNIAQCHRKLGNLQEAITFYRTYLRRAPNVANRAELQRRIAELEREQASHERAAPAPASGPAPAPIPAAEKRAPPALLTATREPAPGREPAAAVLVTRDASAAPVGGAAESAAPFYKRGWFWAVAGAVAVGAVAAVFVVRSRDDAGPFCPDCTSTAGLRGP